MSKFYRISSDFDGMREFDEHGGVGRSVKLEPTNKYDMEVGNLGGRWFRYQFDVYRDVHNRIASFRSRTYILGWLKGVRKCLTNRYLGVAL